MYGNFRLDFVVNFLKGKKMNYVQIASLIAGSSLFAVIVTNCWNSRHNYNMEHRKNKYSTYMNFLNNGNELLSYLTFYPFQENRNLSEYFERVQNVTKYYGNLVLLAPVEVLKEIEIDSFDLGWKINEYKEFSDKFFVYIKDDPEGELRLDIKFDDVDLSEDEMMLKILKIVDTWYEKITEIDEFFLNVIFVLKNDLKIEVSKKEYSEFYEYKRKLFKKRMKDEILKGLKSN